MAELRPIAPSTQADTSSSSSAKNTGTPNTSGTSSGTGGGGHSGWGSNGGGGGGDGGPRRRRHTGQVSMLACTGCRRARARCDGERPAACTRCLSRGLVCQYEPHTKTHKDDLLREIESMRAEHAGLQDEHLDLQESTRDLEKLHQDQSIILDILTNNGHVEEVIRRLREGEEQQSVATWLRGRPELVQLIASIPQSERSLIAVVERVENMYKQNRPKDLTDTIRQWTQVTASGVLIQHLFDLYFTWVHPIHMLFGEADFMKSFRDGSGVFCSSALVNAICAMACHLLESPAPGLTSRDKGDRLELREGFMNEARSLLKPGVQLPMTSIQAFAVMYLVDLSSGKARSASGYLRCAADHIKLPNDSAQQAEESMQLSAWGIHTLNTAWSGITYQKPFNPVSPKTEVFINVQMDKDSAPAYWRYYRQPGDEAYPKRPSYAIITACQQAKLFRVVHDTINIYCGARGRVTASAVIGCLKRFREWKANLPVQVSRIDEESQPLPHVLCLHVQYHTALVQLLSPLARCSYMLEQDGQHIRRVISEHARQGLELIDQCMRLYSCRYNMPLTAFCIVHLGDALTNFQSIGTQPGQVVAFCLNALQQNRPGFPVCGPLQQVFWQTAQERGLDWDTELAEEDLAENLGSLDRYGIDEILDACTRLHYAQPVEQIHRYIDISIGDSWREEWETQLNVTQHRRQSTAERAMQITTLLND